MSTFLSKLAIIGAAFATGNLLRSSGLLTREDAKVVMHCSSATSNVSNEDETLVKD